MWGILNYFFRADYWALGSILAIQQSLTLANADCTSTGCTVPSPGKESCARVS